MLSNFISEGFRAFAEQQNMRTRRSFESQHGLLGRTWEDEMKQKEEEEKKTGDGSAATGTETAEGFSAGAGYPLMNESFASMLGYLLALVISLVIVSLFGQYFWNNSVVKLVSIAKPSTSFIQILGLFVFIRLMFP
jgi:hypothetical protein